MAKKDEKIFQQIALDSDVAAKALERLTDSIQVLDQVANDLRDLDKIAGGIEALGKGLEIMKELPAITARVNSVKFGAFGEQIEKLAEAIEPLRGFTTQATGLVNALGKIQDGVSSVKGTNFTKFPEQMEKLAGGLAKLNIVQAEVGAVIDALSKIKTIVKDVNSLNVQVKGKSAFDYLAVSIQNLTTAMMPLNNIKSTLGAVLRELRRFVATANSLKAMDMGAFGQSIIQIQAALTGLSQVQVGEFDRIAKALRTLVNSFKMLGEDVGAAGLQAFTQNFAPVVQVLGQLGALQNNDFSVIARAIKVLIQAINDLGVMDPKVLESFNTGILKVVDGLATSLQKLVGVDTKGFATLVRNLARLPDLINQFNSIDQPSLDQFLQKIQLLTATLGPLEERLANSVSLIKKMPRSLNSGQTAAERAAKGFGKLNTSLFGLKKLLGFGGITFFIRRLATSLSKAFKISNDFVETLNLFAVSLGQNAIAARDTVSEWQRIIGLDPGEAMEAWGEFNLLLKGFGDDSPEWIRASYMMSQNLTQLAYDLGSLYNVDPSIAFTKLMSAISGMTRPLREWGLDISDASLSAFALSRGITKSVDSMTQAEKAQLRYLLIMQKTSEEYLNVQGDLARTLTTPGNALRILRQQFTQLFRALGDFISPMVSMVLPYVAAFVKGMIVVFQELALFLQELTGYQPRTLEDFVEGAEGATDATDDATDSVESYDEAINSLISGIDKFTTLTKGKGSGVGDIFITEEDLAAYEFAPISNAVDELVFKMQDFFDFVKGALQEAAKFVDSLNITFEGLVELAKTLIAIGITNWLIGLSTGIANATISLTAFNSAATAAIGISGILQTAGIFLLVYGFMKLSELIGGLIKNWDNLNTVEKIGGVIFATLGVAIMLLYSKFLLLNTTLGQTIIAFGIQLFAALQRVVGMIIGKVIHALLTLKYNLMFGTLSALQLAAAIGLLVLGFAALAFGWSEMSGAERFIAIFFGLAAAILAAAIAIGVFHASWTMGIAAATIAGGVALIMASMGGVSRKIEQLNQAPQLAKGGLPTMGSVFIANERGPELVGSFGTGQKSNAVANNDMIVDAIKQASYAGMVEAIRQTNGENGGQKLVLDGSKLNDNALARAILPALRLEVKRNGGAF